MIDFNPELTPKLKREFSMNISLDDFRLREFSHDDRGDLVKMHKDKRVRSLLIDDIPLDNPIYAYKFIERQQELYQRIPGLGIWCARRIKKTLSDKDKLRPEFQALPEALKEAISRPKSIFCGWFNLLPMPDDTSEIELGCRLTAENWGTGYALKGGELLLAHSFSVLNLQRVWIVSHREHRSVDYIAHALGFHRDTIKPYCGHSAQYYCLTYDHWKDWMGLDRRQRLKFGVKSYREAQAGVANNATKTHGTSSPLMEELL